jgi:acetyl esterase/lipase
LEEIVPSQQLQDLCKQLADRPVLAGGTIEEQRAAMESVVGGFPLPKDVVVEDIRVGVTPADWVSMPSSKRSRVVLYLHGGGYVLGSRRTHRELAARIAEAAQARVLVLDYRLAPEHPFPAAVEDATEAYRWLRAQGVAARSIAIAGDSAGGGLTLATLLALRDAGAVLPACAVCLSPWTDLEGTGASAQPGGADDPMVGVAGLRDMGRIYADDALRNPLAAPLHGNYAGLPPLLIQVGRREILLDDATRVAERARAAGVAVTLEIEAGAPHVYQVFPGIPETDAAVKRIGAFVRSRIPG